MTIEEFASENNFDLTTDKENFELFLYHVNQILKDAQQVNSAITNYGPNPAHHLYVMKTTFINWKTLGNSVTKLSDDVENFNYIFKIYIP